MPSLVYYNFETPGNAYVVVHLVVTTCNVGGYQATGTYSGTRKTIFHILPLNNMDTTPLTFLCPVQLNFTAEMVIRRISTS